MQDLFLPHESASLETPFGPYYVVEAAICTPGHGLVLMKKKDANGKYYWLVAERVTQAKAMWTMKNAKEFGHARNRASRYFEKRRVELGGE